MTKYGLKVICETYKREVAKREAFEDCVGHVEIDDVSSINEFSELINWCDVEIKTCLECEKVGENYYMSIDSINSAVDQVFEETVTFYGLV